MTFRDFRRKLSGAVADDNIDEMTHLFERMPLDAKKAINEVFHQYVDTCSIETLKALISTGVDINQHDRAGIADSGSYALGSCIRNNNYANAKLLLESGADSNIGDSLFSLFYMQKGNSTDQIRLCELLLDFGADINKDLENIPGYTPLLKAKDDNAHELVEFMISRGAVEPEVVDETELKLDLVTFQERLEIAIRQCWNAVRDDFPKETFCLFGLETDSDCVMLTPLFDTKEAIERDLKNRRDCRDVFTSHISLVSIDSDSEFYGRGQEFLDELSAELNTVYGKKESERQFAKRKKTVLNIFEAALRNLDNEGVFGCDHQREQLLLVVSIIDADKSEWSKMKSMITRLNPPAVSRLFVDSLKKIT